MLTFSSLFLGFAD